jgi:DNA-binding LacI/PurR family transcriptional regulator
VQEGRFLDDLLSHGIHGAILTSSFGRERNYAALVERGMAMVSLDRMPAEEQVLPIDYVSIDNFHAGRVATQHLLDHGHRSIAFATAPGGASDRLERQQGYLAAMRDAGLADATLVIEQSINAPASDADMAEVGRHIAAQIAKRDQRPTAVVAVSDMVAIGLVTGFQADRMRIPSDISIVGIDDLYLDALMFPAITSVRQPLAEIAEALVSHLLRRLRDPRLPPSEKILKPELVNRSSVARLATAR